MAKNFDIASLQDSQIKIHNAMPIHETSDVLAHDVTHINALTSANKILQNWK